MIITSRLLDAFLKCPTKCFLRAIGETGAGNAYADWVYVRNAAYQREAIGRLKEGVQNREQGRDGRLLFPPEFASVPFHHLGCIWGGSGVHLRDATCSDLRPGGLPIASPSPLSIYFRIALRFKHFGVIHVVTAKSAE